MTAEEQMKMFSELTELLCAIDPAGTGCKENDIVDEYDNEAMKIIDHFVANGIEDREFVHKIFDSSFGPDLYDREAITKAFPTIKRVLLS